MPNITTLSSIRASKDVGRKRSGKTRTLMTARIVALDGEGITDADGEHRYVMLASSLGTHVASASLTTDQCFEYLLTLQPKGERRLLVGFSLNYDIVKWLRNLSRTKLEYLWKNGTVTWNDYTIRYRPSKDFVLKNNLSGKSVHIYDVFGFFQRSFVGSLDEWRVGTKEQVERITSMKATRSEFSNEDTSEMLAYCLEECELLVQLMGKLRTALSEGGIQLEQWYGAGAIAVAIMKKEGVKRYLERKPPPSWERAIMGAYFGGRFELRKSGEFHNVHSYDIRSAYPAILTQLPCLTHATYARYDGYVQERWSIYHLRWTVDKDTPWPPFPFREFGTKQILYPVSGEGYYHAAEVEAALKMYGNLITILESFVMIPTCEQHGCDGKPFGFIPDYYAYRDELKRRGSQAQLTLKLGLNSLYGKTAQGIGWGEQKPPYQSYLWAGMITSGTRGMLLDAISQNPEAILWTATDGIISTEPLDLPCSSALGDWEYTAYRSVFSVQSGVYQKWEGIPYDYTVSTRGFGKRETRFAEIKAAHTVDPINGGFSYHVTRFVGLGSALMRTDFWRYYGKWLPMERRLNFYQQKRFAGDDVGGIPSEGGRVTWYPCDAPVGQSESAPYTPRTAWADMWSDDEAVDILLDAEQP